MFNARNIKAAIEAYSFVRAAPAGNDELLEILELQQQMSRKYWKNDRGIQ